MRTKTLVAAVVFILSLAVLLAACGGGGGSNSIPLSDAKAITEFSFTSPAATGTIDEGAKTISVTVPYGTEVTAIVATFTTTGSSVKVDGVVQESGVTLNNFTNPVAYVVTAADSSTATYTVTVTAIPRFADNGDGTMTDNSTGLMWIKAPDSTRRNWQVSIDYCNGLDFAGYSDWYLPSLAELQELIKGWTGDTPSAWLTSQGFSNVQAYHYWSSTTYAAVPTHAWHVNMYDGYVNYHSKTTFDFYMWPVRGGP